MRVLDTRAHGYFPHGTMPESGRTLPEWEAAQEEYRVVIHGLMRVLAAQPELQELDSDEWDVVAQQVVYWHRDVQHLHPGEFDEDELIQLAVESY